MVTFKAIDKRIRLREFVESEGYEIKRKMYRGVLMSEITSIKAGGAVTVRQSSNLTHTYRV